MTSGPWILWIFDPDKDDINRGGSIEVGFYRSKERAQAVADRCNAKLLTQKQAERQRAFDVRSRIVAEHNALVVAGLRAKEMVLTPLKEEDLLFTDEHYYVEEMRFEDA